MERFLRALLFDLEQRCTALKQRLDAVPDAAEVRDQVVTAFGLLERVRREVATLLADPSLGIAVLLPNHLQQYRRWHERITLVESFPLVFAERLAEPDRRLTALCRRLAGQVGWPLPSPLVGAFSNQYYWTFPAFNLVCLPAGEDTTCLGWADLCHELGHILLVAHRAALVGDFGRDLAGYIRSEQQRIVSGQRPPGYQQLYGLLLVQWQDQWLAEFVSDMVATYLVGPSFGWQHVRLCSSRSQESYFPALGDVAEHPADEARLRAITATLELIGAREVASRLTDLWRRYVSAAGEQPPPDYDVCYPQHLIEGLARRVVDGCRALGLRAFDAAADPATDIPAMLADAWRRFSLDPGRFAGWEQPQLAAFWQDLGFSP